MKQVVILEAVSLAKPCRKLPRKLSIPKLSVKAHAVICAILAFTAAFCVNASEVVHALIGAAMLPSLRAIIIDAAKKGGEDDED